jgi:hypothetical protein
MFNNKFFLNRTVYEVKWKNMVELGRPQMIMWLTPRWTREGNRGITPLFPSTSALDGGGWSAPRPVLFTPGNAPVSTV